MVDFESELKEYYDRREEYLLNKKPQRYKLLGVNMNGFFIADTVKDKNLDSTGKVGYSFIGDFTDKGYLESDKHYNIHDLVDELNYLDFQVNGGLYDDYYHVLSNKDRIHNYILQNIDEKLNHLTSNDKFSICFNDYTKDNIESIKLEVKLSKEGLEDIGDSLLNDKMFKYIIGVINMYLDDVEDSSNRDDMIREDTLIELKHRILEKLALLRFNEEWGHLRK